MSIKDMFRRKTLDHLQGGDDTAEGPQLKRVLTAKHLIVMGVAGIIGTGLFVLTGPAINNSAHPELSAGPSILLSFLLCGLALLLVAFAFGELSSLIPASGSSYTYVYATLGELPAWVIGWDLILEYAFGAAAVAVGWSSYMQSILATVGIHLPDVIAHAPGAVPWGGLTLAVVLLLAGVIGSFNAVRNLRAAADGKGRLLSSAGLIAALIALVCGAIFGFQVVLHLTSVDVLAIVIVVALNFLLVKGMEHTAKATTWFVVIKLAVIAMFVGLGIWHFNSENLYPFMPNGLLGMMAGAGAIFFAFIGFDALTCHAEECQNPQNDMKWGILGSLGISTVIYLLVAATIIGGISWTALAPPAGQRQQDGAAFITFLQHLGYHWAVPVLAVGVIASITSVLLLSLSSQARIMMRMSKDGLVVPFFSKVHPKYQTPYRSIWTCGLVIAVLSGLLPISELAELTSIGTLAAFVLVCVGVIVLRKTEPNRVRKFRCPDAPVVPLLVALAGLVATALVLWYAAAFIWVLVSGGIALSGLLLWLAQRFLGIPWIPAGGAMISLSLMLCLPWVTWVRFLAWLAIGASIYFFYGRSHSKLGKEDANKPK